MCTLIKQGLISVVFLCTVVCFSVIRLNAQTEGFRKISNIRPFDNGATDTQAVLEKIKTAKLLIYKHTDSARSLLGSALKRSEESLFSKGVQDALRALCPLINNSERKKLLAPLKQRCLLNPAMRSALPVIYNAIAKGYELEGRYETSANTYMTAMSLAHLYNPDFLAVLYNNYGSLLTLLPESRNQSLYYLNAAETLARRTKDHQTVTCVLCNKAKLFRENKQYERSKEICLEALQLARQHGFRQWEYVLLNNLGDLYYLMGKPGKALEYLSPLINSRDSVIDRYYKSLPLFTIGDVYQEMGNLKMSEKYFSEALQNAQKQHYSNLELEANQKLAQLFSKNNDFKKAYFYLSAYNNIKDSLRDERSMKHIQTLTLKYQTAESKRKLMKNELDLTHQQQLLQQKNTLLWASGLICVFIILLFYFRFQNKKQLLVKEEKIKEMHAAIQGEEKERARMARDLHDGIGGMLAAINMHVDVASRAPFKNGNMLQDLRQMVVETADEVRITAHNLMPTALLYHNLEEAIRYYCDSVSKNKNINVEFHSYGAINSLSGTEMTLIYRAMQELIQNILKHARAQQVYLSLERSKNEVCLIIEDDGIGFDATQRPWGFGLENLCSRIQAFNGKMNVQSEITIGTSISIYLRV